MPQYVDDDEIDPVCKRSLARSLRLTSRNLGDRHCRAVQPNTVIMICESNSRPSSRLSIYASEDVRQTVLLRSSFETVITERNAEVKVAEGRIVIRVMQE